MIDLDSLGRRLVSLIDTRLGIEAALMKSLKLDEIVTFDQGFDHVSGIRRVEP